MSTRNASIIEGVTPTMSARGLSAFERAVLVYMALSIIML